MPSPDSRSGSMPELVESELADLDRDSVVEQVPFDGGRMRWRRLGRGKPLVLLHGGHGSGMHWVRNARALAARFQVLLPDMPGYGGSDVPREPTLASLVDATLQSLDALVGAGAPILLGGFSFGGLVAATLAARRDAVERLALLGPAGHGGARRPVGALRNWHDAHARGDDAALADAMRHNLAIHMLHDPARVDALALRVHTDACLQTRFRSRPISLAGGLREALAAFHGPLLLVWGEHDVTVVPDAAAQALCAARADCHAVVVPEAGHWVQYEAADAVDAMLLEWFGSR
jgi:pimeloyl-ACP methyl ester carboxylesterase